MCGNLRHKEISSNPYFPSRLSVEMLLHKLNVHVLRSNCAALSGGSPGWKLHTALRMLHRDRIRIDPSRKTNFANFYFFLLQKEILQMFILSKWEQTWSNEALSASPGCCQGGYLGRRQTSCCAGSPMGTGPPLGGMHKYLFSPREYPK